MICAVLIAVGLNLCAPGWVAAVADSAGPVAQVDEETIRQAVLRANSDPIYGDAYRTLNPNLLEAGWGGEALLDMRDDIGALLAVGQYLDLQPEDFSFERIDVLGPGRVRAVTLERWLARLYQVGGSYLGYQRQVVENRYLLERRGDDWVITEVDQDIQGGDPVFRQGEP